MTTWDALALWTRGLVVRLGHLWQLMTNAERTLAAVLLGFVCVTPSVGWIGGSPDAWAAFAVTVVVSWLLLPVLADALVQREDLRDLEADLLDVHRSAPTGAPRVAEVPCRHGDVHRYLYGPDGWVPSGPGADTRPEETRP